MLQKAYKLIEKRKLERSENKPKHTIMTEKELGALLQESFKEEIKARWLATGKDNEVKAMDKYNKDHGQFLEELKK